MKKLVTIPMLCLLLAPFAMGQERTTRERSTRPPKTAENKKEAVLASGAERIRAMIHLPQSAEEARKAGVPEEEVRNVLHSARARHVPAEDLKVVLDAETEEVEATGRPGNFGVYVQTLLDQGLRGRELADAIHRAKAARKGTRKGIRGKGKAHGGPAMGSARHATSPRETETGRAADRRSRETGKERSSQKQKKDASHTRPGKRH